MSGKKRKSVGPARGNPKLKLRSAQAKELDLKAMEVAAEADLARLQASLNEIRRNLAEVRELVSALSLTDKQVDALEAVAKWTDSSKRSEKPKIASSVLSALGKSVLSALGNPSEHSEKLKIAPSVLSALGKRGLVMLSPLWRSSTRQVLQGITEKGRRFLLLRSGSTS